MKIVHVINYFSIDLKYQEYYLAKEQLYLGHEVFFITSERLNKLYGYNSISDTKLNIGTSVEENINIIRLPVLLEIRARVWLKGLVKEIKKLNPDIIIVHGIAQFTTLNIIFADIKARLIIDEHMVMNDYKNNLFNKYLIKTFSFFFKNQVLDRADKIIPISDSSKYVVETLFNFKSDKVKMVSLGVDTKIFSKENSLRTAFRNKHLISNEDIVITYTGKIVPYKNVHLIIDALNQYEGKQTKITILLVGNISSDYKELLKSKIQNSKFRCIHLDSVPHHELPKVYNATDIAIWPDSQTISTLEATACGVPVICSDFLTERYSYNNGFGVIPGNLKSIIDSLFKLIDDENLRNKMSENSLIYAKEKLDWKKINEEFLR